MQKQKLHREFFSLAADTDWEQIPGYPDGMEVRVLADNLDEAQKTGTRTRLIRWQAGAQLAEPVQHAYCEEIMLLDGDLIVIDPATGEETKFEAPTFACRPDGVPHGPFRTAAGCTMLEFNYFDAEGFAVR